MDKKQNTRIYILLLSLFFSFTTFSQKQRIIEPADIEIHYDFKKVIDTLNREQRTFQDRMILRIGEQSSQFFNRNVYFRDSMMIDPNSRKLLGQMIVKAAQEKRMGDMPGGKTEFAYLYKNYPKGKITTTDHILMDNYIYEEEYVPQNWIIQDSTKQLLTYTCQKAVCDFRGRQWVAWFALDIPIDNGPWKLNGLPGIIMEAHDIDKHFHYVIVGIKQSDLPPITFYNLRNKKFEKTDRLTFLKTKRKIYTNDNANQLIQAGTGIDLKLEKVPPNRKQQTAYDYMERDYK